MTPGNEPRDTTTNVPYRDYRRGDDWVSTPRGSASLAGRTSRDTTPEIVLRRQLHRLGLRYRLHPRLGSRLTADLVFRSARVVVFVDGCFWHGCPIHSRWRPNGP